MHAHPKPRLSRHRQTRIIAWALATLLWLRSVLCGVRVIPRHLRQRGAWLSLDDVARLITDLVGIRAAALAGNRAPRKRLFRDRGVDLRRRHFRRSVIGSCLRRALKHRDFDARLALLIRALRDLDLLATRLARRMRRRVTSCGRSYRAPARRPRLQLAPPARASTPIRPRCVRKPIRAFHRDETPSPWAPARA